MTPLRPCHTCATICPSGHCPNHPRRGRTDRPSAQDRNPNTNWWRTTSRHILTRDHWTCTYCGAPARTVDHIYPRHLGGTHAEDNLTAACRSCNGAKGRLTLAQWIATGAPPGAHRLHRKTHQS